MNKQRSNEIQEDLATLRRRMHQMPSKTENPLGDILREELANQRGYDVEACVLVVRHKITREVLSAQVLSDNESEASVSYNPEYIDSIDVLKEALKNRAESTRQMAYFHYIEGKSFTLSGEAHYLPSIGNIEVAVEYKTIIIK